MATRAMFPKAALRAGMYESFYLRAVAPDAPLGVWIRHTVTKDPGRPARGSVWCTVFDGTRGRPFMHKLNSDQLSVPSDRWIEIGQPAPTGEEADEAGGEKAAGEESRDAAQGARMGPSGAHGRCGPARWEIGIASREPELRHLPREWLYRAPLLRTKLTSPAPAASFDGRLTLADERPLELRGWRGMVGHNWGAEHAERWIWLHGIGFAQAPEAWLDVAIGRVMIAGRLTPWVANGALELGGRRYRIGGLGARGLRVSESPHGCTTTLVGERGLRVQAHFDVPADTAAGWHYGDPGGGQGHDVVNCSIASVRLAVTVPGERTTVELSSPHGGVYELGMRERDHGVPIAPFD
jgi:hypothetical protein